VGANVRSILIVDDAEDVADSICMILQGEGYRGRIANAGCEALEIVQNEPVAMVLLDLWMPVMDGWEFLERLRSLPPPASDVPVVVMTADHGAYPGELPVEGFLFKPLEIRGLLETVKQVLGSTRHRGRVAKGGGA
jgi:CheY-like chemotaxis protein